jgi:hypothetical protein
MAGPAHFILYVADQAAVTAFWTAVLGRSPSLDVPGMTEFTLNQGTRAWADAGGRYQGADWSRAARSRVGAGRTSLRAVPRRG